MKDEGAGIMTRSSLVCKHKHAILLENCYIHLGLSSIMMLEFFISLLFCLISYCSYLSEGFLHLQKLVGESVIEWEVMKAGKEYQSINIVVRVRNELFS